MMELIAMHLKCQGSYLARCLSYEECRFDTIEDAVSPEQIAQYDAAAGLWQEVLQQLEDGVKSGLFIFPLKKNAGRKSRRIPGSLRKINTNPSNLSSLLTTLVLYLQYQEAMVMRTIPAAMKVKEAVTVTLSLKMNVR